MELAGASSSAIAASPGGGIGGEADRRGLAGGGGDPRLPVGAQPGDRDEGVGDAIGPDRGEGPRFAEVCGVRRVGHLDRHSARGGQANCAAE